MNLQFLGAAREVGRSCLAIEEDGLNMLFDCGVAANQQSPLPPLQNAKNPQAIAVSHAHLDHSGFLPAVFKHSNPPVLCTFPTVPLINMLLEDMQKLLDEKGLAQFFSGTDLMRLNRSVLAMPYEMEYEFFNGAKLQFFDAGHISGSAQVFLEGKGTNLLYSGDINSIRTEMHNPAKIPDEDIGVLVMESTYGGREHGDRKKLVREFCKKIRIAVEQKHSVVIPSFAVGRTQEILQLLYENGLIHYTVMDGMGIRTTETYLEFPSYLRNAGSLREAFEEADKSYDSEDRKKFAKAGKIIVATAGMLEGGPALGYISRLQNAGIPTHVFLTGFQAAGTNGRMLKEKKMIRINGKIVEFRGEVHFFDFSAHSGRKELLQYAKKINPKKIFLVHGDLDEMSAFHGTLLEEGFDCKMPEMNEKFEV
ncbi:MAG TPA: MBL fold metallo-hydrolase [Candidatus Norongarragalinales archaeon]|nr:MBL fold metallo-hydrolase [Candidatus Norongarragalinales archaeon]